MSSRIGIDGRCLCDHYPGIGRYVFHLVSTLPQVACGEEFVVLVDPGAPNSRFDLDFLATAGLEVVALPAPLRSLREQVELPRRARSLGFDLFHAPYWWTAWRMPCPTVVTLYDLLPAHPPPTPFRHWRRTLRHSATRLAYHFWLRRLKRSARLVLTLSQTSRQEITELLGLPRQRVVLTPGAADPRFRPATRDEKVGLRRRLGLPRPYVLWLGSNKPHKNLEGLVEAWARVEARGAQGYDLVLAGPQDPRYPEARRRSGELGLERIRFLGAVAEADLPDLVRGADLFVFPSLGEGFGLPVLEAMACGVAVACSNLPVLVELTGDAARLFDPADPASMARTLDELMRDEDLRWRCALMSRQRARAFSWHETARLTLAAYHRALESRSPV